MHHETPDQELDALAPALTAEERVRLQHAIAVAQRADAAAGTMNAEAGWQALGIVGAPASQGARQSHHMNRAPRLAMRAVASALSIGAIAGLAFLVTRRAHDSAVARPTVYATTAAQHATVTLRDGSTVQLGDATTLTVPADFSAEHRTITLDGQAYFVVPNASRAPFIVRAKSSETRVLGTAFNVRSYREERYVRVTVNAGKVSVHAGATSTVLTSRMLAIVTDSGQITVSPQVAADTYSAWTTGRLVFQQTLVREIVAELGRAYGADIRVADSTLGHQRLTWTVPTNRLTLAQALDGLTGALDAHTTRAGSVITLVAGAPATQKSATPLRSHSLEAQYGR